MGSDGGRRAVAGSVRGVRTRRRAGLPRMRRWSPAGGGRRRGSGFGHGELLARAVARRLRLPAARLLTRDPGPSQTGRTRTARRPGPSLRPTGTAARDRAVLLVDDVLTTGATL